MDDYISRQAAIDALADMHCKSDEDGYVWIIRSDAWARIDALPSAQPEIKERTEEFAQNVPKEDLISRKAAIEAMSESLKRVFPEHRQIAKKCLKALPSAQPDVTGINVGDMVSRQAAIEKEPGENVKPVAHAHWNEDEYGFYSCSNCGYEWDEAEYKTKYCPECGAKMDEQENGAEDES